MVKPKPPVVTITTVTATKGYIGVYLDAIGTVTAVHTASITSQVTGSIVAVNYKEGQAQGALERDESVLAHAQGYRRFSFPDDLRRGSSEGNGNAVHRDV